MRAPRVSRQRGSQADANAERFVRGAFSAPRSARQGVGIESRIVKVLGDLNYSLPSYFRFLQQQHTLGLEA